MQHHGKIVSSEDVWCRTHNGHAYSFDEYLQLIESFHGHAAPGLVIGGKMVDTALARLPEGILFDAICETSNCLPDAIQLLTPCTVGNGWLNIIHLGRFSITLYDKYQGTGIRIFTDTSRLESWDEIRSWFLGLKSKKEQDSQALLHQIRQAGADLFGIQKVQVRPQFLKKIHLGQKAVCPLCGESYPLKHGAICRGCQGDAPYFDSESEGIASPKLKTISLKQSEGRRILHDMTQIIPGESKGVAFEKGHVISAGDVCRLQQMGRMNIMVDDGQNPASDWVHENDAALAFAQKMAGNGISFTLPPKEGKINLTAEIDGMLLVDDKRLEMFNLVPGVMCASRKNYSLMAKGRSLAGTRAIPLYLPKSDFYKALSILEHGPLFEIKPLRQAKIGILVTGTEVFQGLIKDSFIPIIQAKAEALNSVVVKSLIVPDHKDAICNGIKALINSGADLIITTAGLSVDPDDVTRQGISDAGAQDMLYGAPILPGAMTLLARIGNVQLFGVPACALYFKTTSLDLLLPRLLAGVAVTRSDLAKIGHGAFCLDCKICTFPRCPFGK
jgi:formylmethanofuran dehydrogenase subunit E